MLKTVLIGLSLTAATVAFAADKIAPTAPEPPLVVGVDNHPDNFEKGDVARYGVWHLKDEGWHVHVTTAGHKHHFKGTIKILGDGSFDGVKDWQGEGKGKKADTESAGWFSKNVKVDGKTLSFDIVSEDKHVSGLQFLVKGTGPLEWNLCIGGPNEKDALDCKTSQVKLGHDGNEPPAMPFRTYAHPDKEGHGK